MKTNQHARKVDIAYSRELFRERDFWEENKPKERVAWAMSFVCNALSVFTAFTFPFLTIASILPEWLGSWAYVVSGLISFLLCVVLEYVLRLELGTLFRQAVRSHWRDVSFTRAAWILLLFACSLLSSMQGAKQFVLQTDNRLEVLEASYQQDTARVSSFYRDQLQQQESELAAYKASVSWMGRIDVSNPTTKKVVASYTDRIDQLRQQQAQRLEELRSTMQEASTQQRTDTSKTATMMALFSGGNVSLYLLLMWYIWHFHHRIYLDETEESEEGGKEVKFTPQEKVEPKEKPAIGFVIPSVTERNVPAHGNRTTVNDRSEIASKNGYEITCKHCGTVATMKSSRAIFCSDSCRVEYHKTKN